MPSRADPFGDYDHLQPVPMEEAIARLTKCNQAAAELRPELDEANGKLEELKKKAALIVADTNEAYQLIRISAEKLAADAA